MLQNTFVFNPRVAFAPRIGKGQIGIDAPAWDRVPAIGGFSSRQYGAVPRYPVEVKVACTAGGLALRFRAADPDAAGFVSRAAAEKKHYTGWWCDFFEFIFDPGHTHADFIKVTVDPAGEARVTGGYMLQGELYGDRIVTRIGTAAWEGVVEIPAAVFGPRATFAKPWGFQVLRFRPRHLLEAAVWQTERPHTPPTPQDYGDLYFEESAPRVAVIDLGRVVFDRNTLKLTLDRTAPAGLTARARVYLPIGKTTASDATAAFKRGSHTVRLPFTPDFHGRWPVHKDGYQRLMVDLQVKGRPVYSCEYILSYDVAVRVEDPYGHPGAKRPKPSDPDFLRKYNAFICGRLPWFERRSTRDGAKGDFILAAVDGSVKFDLMAPDVLDRIARYIYGRYDNDMDRLQGASSFFHQRTVTRHSGSGSAFGDIDAAGLFRLGAALCGHRAQALTLFLKHMDCQTARRKHWTHCLGLAGHIVTLVDPSWSIRDDDHGFEDHLVLDPDIGQMLISLDNTRIATLTELRAHRDISYRSNFNNFRHGHEFYYATAHQTFDEPTVCGTFPDYLQ
ncbi:MAG: hypothetical protein ABIF71_01200 [Planctomycetota bacterium]